MINISCAIKSFILALQSEKRISLNSKLAYAADLKNLEHFLYEKFSLKELNIDINIEHILQELYFLFNNLYAQTTQARKMSTCIQFFKFVWKDFFQKEFLFDIPKIKIQTVCTPFLEEDDLEKIRKIVDINSKKMIRLSAIIETLYSTGMRISELLQLKKNDMENIKKNRYLLIKGKGGVSRYVFFNELCVNALEKYLLLPFCQKSHFLFGSKLRAISRQRVFQLLKELAETNQIDPKRIFAHSFRHRMLTDLVKNGADLVSVQKIAGHKQISTTARYTHIEDNLYEDISAYHPINKK